MEYGIGLKIFSTRFIVHRLCGCAVCLPHCQSHLLHAVFLGQSFVMSSTSLFTEEVSPSGTSNAYQ